MSIEQKRSSALELQLEDEESKILESEQSGEFSFYLERPYDAELNAKDGQS